jgi:hypothetical protein
MEAMMNMREVCKVLGVSPATVIDLVAGETAALSYAEKDYLVFPCKPRSKQPATRNGSYDATTDEEQIREWWRENASHNVAIRTGKESGIFGLEEDEDDAIKAQSWYTTPTPIAKTSISAKTAKPVESRSWWRSGNYTNRLRAIRM